MTLFASGDSRALAPVRSVFPQSLRTAEHLADKAPYEWMHIATALRLGRDYDLIHSHAGELAMAMGMLADVPMLTTMHCLITPDTHFVWERYRGWYNTISYAQRAWMPALSSGIHAGVVHNAIDATSFPFSSDKERLPALPEPHLA